MFSALTVITQWLPTSEARTPIKIARWLNGYSSDPERALIFPFGHQAALKCADSLFSFRFSLKVFFPPKSSHTSVHKYSMWWGATHRHFFWGGAEIEGLRRPNRFSRFAVHLSFRRDAFLPQVSMRSSKRFRTNFTSTGLSGRLWFWSCKKLSTWQLCLFCPVDCWPSSTLPRSLSHRSSQQLAGLHESRQRAHRFTCQGCKNHTAPNQLLKILTGALQSLDQSARGVGLLWALANISTLSGGEKKKRRKSLMRQNSCGAFYQCVFPF